MIFSVINITTAFAAGATFTVNADYNKNTSVATVTVSMTANSNIAAATFALTYDTQVLTLNSNSAKVGDALKGGFSDVNEKAASNEIRVACINVSGFNTAGTVLTASFKVKSGTDKIPLEFKVLESKTLDAKNVSTTASYGNSVVQKTTTPTTTTTTTNPAQTATETIDLTSKSATEAEKIVQTSMEKLLNAAKAAEKAGHRAVVELKIAGTPDQTTASIDIPRKSFADMASLTKTNLKLTTNVATVSFDSKAIKAIAASKDNGNISVKIAKEATPTLSDENKTIIGSNSAYTLTVKAGALTISDFGNGKAEIGIPYTLKQGEDQNAVVAYYIKDANSINAARGKFNAKSSTYEYTVTAPSKVALGYNKVAFSDVATTDWFYKPVTFIASRKITSGTGDNKYSPAKVLTRAEFIVLMMNAYEIKIDENPTDNFSDAGNTYYTNYLATAKRTGISAGVGNNMFAPNKELSRQEMYTLLYNTLKVLDELPKAGTGKELEKFTDSTEIDSWATEAIKVLTAADVVGEGTDKIAPKNPSTRAEMALALFNLLSR